MSTYLGFDVLDIRTPNRLGPLTEDLDRDFTLLDPETGKRLADDHATAPKPVRPFIWSCWSRAMVGVLRTFLDARKGRAVPFWLPSYQQDLTLAVDLANAAGTMTVHRVNYAKMMFPAGGGRRHVALYYPGSVMVFRKITAAAEAGDALTETATLSSPSPQLFPATTTIVSFLKLCRLDEDLTEIAWSNGQVAQAAVRAREIPQEAVT